MLKYFVHLFKGMLVKVVLHLLQKRSLSLNLNQNLQRGRLQLKDEEVVVAELGIQRTNHLGRALV